MKRKFDEKFYNEAIDELIECIGDQEYQIQELLETIQAKEEQLENLKRNFSQMMDSNAEILEEYINENTILRAQNNGLQKRLDQYQIKEHKELHDLVRGFNNPLETKKTLNMIYGKTVDLDDSYPFNKYQE